MGFLDAIDVSASGLTAQRLRMDTIANNMANVETTRTVSGGPYKRQVVVFEARRNPQKASSFKNILAGQSAQIGAGVRVKEIKAIDTDKVPFRRVYDPGHPDADQEGYVNYPNVNIVEEMVNMISATRAYQANAQAVEATRNMALRALEIGR